MNSDNQNEPLFMQANDLSDDFIASVREARRTLPTFKSAFQNPKYKGSHFLLKSKFVYGEATNGEALIWKSAHSFPTDKFEIAHIWLLVNDLCEDISFTSTFEVPGNFGSLKKGQSFVLCDEDIEDWMINNNGDLYGGYSIRIHRDALHETERSTFDRLVGVTNYMNELP